MGPLLGGGGLLDTSNFLDPGNLLAFLALGLGGRLPLQIINDVVQTVEGPALPRPAGLLPVIVPALHLQLRAVAPTMERISKMGKPKRKLFGGG